MSPKTRGRKFTSALLACFVFKKIFFFYGSKSLSKF